ncbi:MAG: GNAT family N-acetyltransferase [Anaerolineae bacterium]|nr:GNAT family N-acetyltransferase [Anaerolineae bacterium]
MTTIEPIDLPDAVKAAMAVFRDAFRDDPGMVYICQREHGGYEQRLTTWFGATLHLQIANHQPVFGIQQDGEYIACAMLTLPNARLSLPSLLRWLSAVASGTGVRTVWRTLSHLQRIGPYQPQMPHVRLEFIAVAPAHQGKGHARRLLDDIHQLSESHAESSGVWLETVNPANVPLYLRLGYGLTQHLSVAHSVETWIMFRPNSVV